MKNRIPVIAIIFFTIFLNMLGITIVIPVVAPLLFDNSDILINNTFVTVLSVTFVIGLLKASYPIMQFFGAPVLGELSDRIGRRKVLIYSLIGSLTGYILFAIGIIQMNIYLLFAGRIIDGITGGNIAVIYSSLADISDDKSKPRNFGLVGMAFGIGFVLGPFIGGITSDPEVLPFFNYATPFWISALLTFVNIVLVIVWFPETKTTFNKVKLHIFSGLRNLQQAFSDKRMNVLFLSIFFTVMGFSFFTQFFDVFMIKRFDYDQRSIGLLFGYIGIWIAISQGLITRYVSHYINSSTVLKTSIILTAVSLFVISLPQQDYFIYILAPFISIFQGLNQPNYLTILSNHADSSSQGKVLGINQSLQSLGISIPPVIAGLIISFNVNLPLWAASLFTFIAWILYLIYSSRKP